MASIRDAIADHLLLHGYQVRLAADAAALDVLLQAERPDLIILDWMMPGEDGCRLPQAAGEGDPDPDAVGDGGCTGPR